MDWERILASCALLALPIFWGLAVHSTLREILSELRRIRQGREDGGGLE